MPCTSLQYLLVVSEHVCVSLLCGALIIIPTLGLFSYKEPVTFTVSLTGCWVVLQLAHIMLMLCTI